MGTSDLSGYFPVCVGYVMEVCIASSGQRWQCRGAAGCNVGRHLMFLFRIVRTSTNVFRLVSKVVRLTAVAPRSRK